MFNLYQNHALTKDMILSQQLHQCKLVFQLCIRRGNQYISVSDPAYSAIIEESKFYHSIIFVLLFY